jgi:serine/threonine protein kinase
LQFCGGGNLREYLKQDQFDKSEFVRVNNELLSGILYLHQRGIAHRDLKPENGE